MSDFVFKNLAVRLFPAADEVVCTGGSFCDDDHTCGDLETCGPLSGCGFCSMCTGQTCGDELTNQVVLAADSAQFRSGLAAHKRRLQEALERVERQEEQLAARTHLTSLEEVDALRGQLSAALSQLDEYRERLLSENAPGPE